MRVKRKEAKTDIPKSPMVSSHANLPVTTAISERHGRHHFNAAVAANKPLGFYQHPEP